MRDLRLAVLIEDLYAKVYFADGRGTDLVRKNPLRRTWPTLNRWFDAKLYRKIPQADIVVLAAKTEKAPKESRCLACGGPHHVMKCPVRQEYPPSEPCLACGNGTHWRVDCPKYTFPCPACGERHRIEHCLVRRDRLPTRPCSRCGGKHWRVDCDLSVPPLDRTPKTSPADPTRQLPQKNSIRKSREPCPNCRGDHWLVDCREPQAPPEALRKLRLETATVESIDIHALVSSLILSIVIVDVDVTLNLPLRLDVSSRVWAHQLQEGIVASTARTLWTQTNKLMDEGRIGRYAASQI